MYTYLHTLSPHDGLPIFSDHHVARMAGYLGNDRMAKETQSVGRPATPFPVDVEALLQELYGALEAFNSTPKEGLENRSAYQVWQGACDGGWRPAKADLATMIEALSRPEQPTATRGVIHYNNTN